jgi:pimeloyl-[acyl-carrier protein] methyl ester esterase
MTATLHAELPAASASLPLVCLHGWGMNLRVFDPLRVALADLCPSGAVDLAGHGRSGWNVAHADFSAQVDALLTRLPARCTLLGWSFGGQLALEIAARAPQRIAALVLVCSTPKFAQSPDWMHGLDADARGIFRAMLQQDWQQTLSDFIWLQLRGSRNAAAAQAQLEAALLTHGAPNLAALGADLDLLDHLDLRARVSAVTQPALVLTGQHDRVTPAGASQWLADALPAARLQEIPRAGHAPFVSHVEEFAAALRSFLLDVAARTHTPA